MRGRGNGLRAESYTPLAVLDPQVADLMLELLRDQGIAAYAVPYAGETGPYQDVRPPDRPKDRLWVDARATERARQVLDQLVNADAPVAETRAADSPRTGLEDIDEEEAWRQIVANFRAEAAEPVPRWPAAEDLEPEDEDEDPEERHRGRLLRRRDREIEPPEPEEIRGADEEEHFVPPPPPPLPKAEPVTKAAWCGVVGGPAFLLIATILGWQVGTLGFVLGVGAF
ncbi:hypothetical protein, partial [Carbonactinospora thermoautotrophica]